MIVVLEQDSVNLGKANELVDVKRGYALNFLIPEGIASVPDKTRLMKIQAELQAKESNKLVIVEKASQIQKSLEGKTLNIAKKVAAKGTLYGSVSEKEILDGVEKEFGVHLDDDMITIPHVKTVGEHSVEVSITAENTFHFILNVTKEV